MQEGGGGEQVGGGTGWDWWGSWSTPMNLAGVLFQVETTKAFEAPAAPGGKQPQSNSQS